MRELIHTDYYNHPSGVMSHRTKDITSKELKEAKEAKELRQAVTIVTIVFAIITLLAIILPQGNSYI